MFLTKQYTLAATPAGILRTDIHQIAHRYTVFRSASTAR